MGFLYSQLFVSPQAPTEPLLGQTLIITGSNTGLGYTAAQSILGLQPARLILAVRNDTKGRTARESLISSTPNYDASKTTIEVWTVDQSSFSSVLAFADKCNTTLDRLDGISLNAGIVTSTYRALEGYESTLTVNVISTFLLALALLPKLQDSARKYNTRPRISIVASEVHAWASFREKSTPADQSVLKAMSDPSKAAMSDRYQSSKLLEILVFRHLMTLLPQKDVTWNILNPGFCYSELMRDEKTILFKVLQYVLARTQEVGGRPVAAGLVAGPESHGMYMHDGVVDEGELKDIFENVRPGLTAGL